MVDVPSADKNHESSSDSSYNPISSEEDILEGSQFLSIDTDESESEGMDTAEACATKGYRFYLLQNKQDYKQL